MAKVDWENLEVIEEYSTIDQANAEQVKEEMEKIKFLAVLIAKAYGRHKQRKKKSTVENLENGVEVA